MQIYAPLQIHFGPVCAFPEVMYVSEGEFSFRYTGDHVGIPSPRMGDAAHETVTVLVCKYGCCQSQTYPCGPCALGFTLLSLTDREPLESTQDSV